MEFSILDRKTSLTIVKFPNRNQTKILNFLIWNFNN